MILTQCAVCATDLGLTRGKKCGRCSTRYCGAACQEQHWKEGGHDQLCKKIKRSGGAEQYNANQKYTEAVAAAVEKCADDTKGQTCFICTQALHWKTGEGLVRGCACRGTAGFAHVSCLAEQAKILVAEAEENNLDVESRWNRWCSCSLCEQQYHGVVRCALAWACWKTYLGRPERDWNRRGAMTQLGNGLSSAEHDEAALIVKVADLSMHRRLGAAELNILVAQGNLANTYSDLGRFEQALSLKRDVYLGTLKLGGEEHGETIREAVCYTSTLLDLRRFKEAKTLSRKTTPVARRVLGETHQFTLQMRTNYARALYMDHDATLEDLCEAMETLEDLEPTARRVLGGSHPLTTDIRHDLHKTRERRSAPAKATT